MALDKKMVKGRQIAHIVFHHYELTATEGAVLEFSDLISVELKSDNLATFLTDWEYTICGMRATPPADIMETLFIKQLRKCGHLKENMALYDLEVTQKGVPRSYDRLLSMVRTHLEARRRNRNRENLEKGHGHVFWREKAATKEAKAEERAEKGNLNLLHQRAFVINGLIKANALVVTTVHLIIQRILMALLRLELNLLVRLTVAITLLGLGQLVRNGELPLVVKLIGTPAGTT
eukprot:10872838-Karenia_brevis.AAC.1